MVFARRVVLFAGRSLARCQLSSSGRGSAALFNEAPAAPAASAPPSRVRGTRDFDPVELRLRDWLFGH